YSSLAGVRTGQLSGQRHPQFQRRVHGQLQCWQHRVFAGKRRTWPRQRRGRHAVERSKRAFRALPVGRRLLSYVRHELELLRAGRYSRQSAPDPQPRVALRTARGIYQLAAAQGVTVTRSFLNCCIQNTLVPRDKKDFAPRIGLSWRPFDTDRFVVRAGYGIFYDIYMRYYDQVQNYDENSLQTILPASYPTASGNGRAYPGPKLNQLWSAPIQGLGGAGGRAGTGAFTLPKWDSNDFLNTSYILNQVNWPWNHNPYNQQWTLDTQYALRPTLLLDVGYVGSHGLRLPTYFLFNAAPPPPVPTDPCNGGGSAPLGPYLDISQVPAGSPCLTDPNLYVIDQHVPYPNLPSEMYANANILNSNYNSLQVQMRQGFDHGLTYNIAYTWSKSLDEISGINLVNGNNNFIQDPQHIGADYGPSSFDQTHRLTANGSWELPVGKGKRWSLGPANWVLGGWKASGIYSITSGRTLTPYGYNGANLDEMGIYNGSSYDSRYRPMQSGNPNSGFHR